jgi:hypothetical protein
MGSSWRRQKPGHHTEEAAASFLGAMAEEVLCVLGGVNAADFNVVARNARCDEQLDIGLPQVQVRIALRSIRAVERSVGIGQPFLRQRGDLRPHFVALRADTRANADQHARGIGAVSGLHGAQQRRRSAVERAAPPCMNNAQGMMVWVVDENRRAIGEDQAERQADGIGDQAVTAVDHGAGVFPAHLGNIDTMHLTAMHHVLRSQAERCRQPSAIFLYAFRHVPACHAEVQAAPWLWADAAVTGGDMGGNGRARQLLECVGDDAIVVMHTNHAVSVHREACDLESKGIAGCRRERI